MDNNIKMPLPPIYTECDLSNAVANAIAKTKEDFFSFFKENVDSLITERLLDFCKGHPAITSMDILELPIVNYK